MPVWYQNKDFSPKFHSHAVNKRAPWFNKPFDLHRADDCSECVSGCLYLWAAAGTEGSSALVSAGSVSEPGWHISDSSKTKQTDTEASNQVILDWKYRQLNWSISNFSFCFQLYLKLSDNSGERGVFPALFVQQSHVVVKLADVGGVHLQVGTLLDKDVWQSLVIAPETRQTQTVPFNQWKTSYSVLE